jgi:Phosphotransferase enzyme family
MQDLHRRMTDTTSNSPMWVGNALINGAFGPEVLGVAIPELRSGAWRLLSCHSTAGWKQRHNCIVFCRMSYRDQRDKRARTAQIVAKVYRGDRGSTALGALQRLWEAGFRPPARYRVPRPYGYSREHGILVQAVAPGVAWADFLRGAEQALSVASARAAAWLIQLQQSPIDAEATGWEGDVVTGHRRVQELLSTFPHHALRLEPLAARLLGRLPSDGSPPMPSHGDYHPGNVFLSPGLTTVIDLDHFGRREAAFDVGYAIGQLLIMSYIRTGALAPGARAALAFWRRYRHGGQAAWPRVAVHVARTLLQSLHFELCTLRNNRLELLGAWPALMQEWLDSDGPTTLEDLIRHRRSLSLR